ncbi:hypothetical protein CDL12_25043 [Handroanthus impetiginosus]|uniref:Uncharacterized protein n=1 Tax=Handroanthus impetiginosus TaxID=429701 RepID=A0A2G9GAY6_9LAMI|nr:hypothetical protein CDL12_25043 [Handroanthus impetiginosus]
MKPEFQSPPPAVATGVGLRWWSSPVPFLLGGLALMFGVMALALILLACSYKQRLYESSMEEKSEKRVHVLEREMETIVVVIMAGETIPTHLAKPAAEPPLFTAVQKFN